MNMFVSKLYLVTLTCHFFLAKINKKTYFQLINKWKKFYFENLSRQVATNHNIHKLIKFHTPKLNKNNPQMIDQDQINPESQPHTHTHTHTHIYKEKMKEEVNLLEIEGRYSFACGSERISLNWWEKRRDNFHGKKGFFSLCVWLPE